MDQSKWERVMWGMVYFKVVKIKCYTIGCDYSSGICSVFLLVWICPHLHSREGQGHRGQCGNVEVSGNYMQMKAQDGHCAWTRGSSAKQSSVPFLVLQTARGTAVHGIARWRRWAFMDTCSWYFEIGDKTWWLQHLDSVVHFYALCTSPGIVLMYD